MNTNDHDTFGPLANRLHRLQSKQTTWFYDIAEMANAYEHTVKFGTDRQAASMKAELEKAYINVQVLESEIRDIKDQMSADIRHALRDRVKAA